MFIHNKLKYILFVSLICTSISAQDEAFLPENPSSAPEVINRFSSNAPVQKSATIVIDGEELGVNNTGTTSTQTSNDFPGFDRNWFRGIQNAYSNIELIYALLRRSRPEIPEQSDFRELLDNEKYREIHKQLKWKTLEMARAEYDESDKRKIADMYCCMGLAELATVNFHLAEKSFRNALDFYDRSGAARMLLADTYAREGRFEDAHNTVLPLLKSAYLPVRLSDVLSRIYQHKNRISRAMEHWERVLDRIRPGGEEMVRYYFLQTELYVQNHFLTYSTSHYEVKYDPAFQNSREEIISPLLSMVEEARWRLNKRFGVTPDDKTIINIYAENTMNKILGGSLLQMEAFFNTEDGKLRVTVLENMKNNIKRLRPIIFHEYVHRLIHHITRGRMQIRWVHEGLATWYERELTGIDRFYGFSRSSDSEPINLDTLLKNRVDAEGYYNSRRVMDYLMENFGEKKVILMLREIGNGRNLDSSMKSAFGMSYNHLKEKIRKELTTS